MTLESQLPKQFVNWKSDDKRGKIPCSPTGVVIDAHLPENWTDHATASSSSYGVGFVLTEADPWFFLDLDKCYDEAKGVWTAEADMLFKSFPGAWGEVSQSGKGLHVMGHCDASRLSDRRNKWDGWKEFYTSKRFIAFGGHGWSQLGGAGLPGVTPDHTDILLKIVPERAGDNGELLAGRDERWSGPEDDDALIQRALASGSVAAKFGQGVTFADLWTASEAALARQYPAFDGDGVFDRSSADMALMCQLAFWTGKDRQRMDRLFRRSALCRDKYLTRDDYRQSTIRGAVTTTTNVYVETSKPSKQADVTLETYLSVPEMHELFKGCVYVTEQDRILDLSKGLSYRQSQFAAKYGGHKFQMMPDATKPSDNAYTAFTQCCATQFPKVDATTFRPDLDEGVIVHDGVGKTMINSYVNPRVVITPGDATPFTSHITKMVPDEQDRRILLSYLAAIVQYQGKKFQWSVVVQGVEGNGKTMLKECIQYIVGQRYTHTPTTKDLDNAFTAWLEDKIFICVEEVDMRNRMKFINNLKPLVSNERISVEAKGVDQRMIDNTANWLFCTNHKDGVIKTVNDRRYAIFYTAQQEASDLVRDNMDGQYFPRLWDWLKYGGGFAIVGHYLQNYKIDDDLNPATKATRAPVTSSTEEAIELTRGPISQTILEAVDNGVEGFRGGWVSSGAVTKLFKDNNIKCSAMAIGNVLKEIGYVKLTNRNGDPVRLGVSDTAPIPQYEPTKTPYLWYCGDASGLTKHDFMVAQGYLT